MVPLAPCHYHAFSANQIVGNNNTVVTGISAPLINIYPNPTHNEIIITGSHITCITVADAVGIGKLHRSVTANKVNIDISTLPAGIYLVTVTSDNGSRVVSEIVKQ